VESLVFVLLGLLGLWLGTELALHNTIELAERWGLSQGFLGLTVLAVGTDLPELVVAIDGSIQQLQGVDTAGIVVGNAVGSAIANGSLVLGVAGLFGTLHAAPRMIRRDGMVLMLSIALLGLLSADGQLTRLEGGALLAAYAIYYAALVQAERSRPKPPSETRGRAGWLVLSILGGILLVVFSADLVVDSAVSLAELQGWDQTVIGLLLVGAGTSLPELVLSLGAAAKGRTGLAVGNVIGSNIFNMLVPLGVGGAIHPLTVGLDTLVLDLPFVAFVTVTSIVFFVRKPGLQRSEAVTLIVLYVGFALARTLVAVAA